MASSVNGYVLSPIKHMVKKREIKNDAQSKLINYKIDFPLPSFFPFNYYKTFIN